MNFLFWTLTIIASFSVVGTIALVTFIFLHRMGRATSRFDRREEKQLSNCQRPEGER